jgi:hypothetical protein
MIAARLIRDAATVFASEAASGDGGSIAAVIPGRLSAMRIKRLHLS